MSLDLSIDTLTPEIDLGAPPHVAPVVTDGITTTSPSRVVAMPEV